MANDEKRRRRQHGRRTEHSFLGIPHYIVRGPEFGAIEPWALKLLIELAASYNGKNNGNLSAAYSTLRERGWNSPGTLNKAINQLVANGWLVRTRHGGRNRCALYAVTWWAVDACEGKWLEIQPETTARHAWKTISVVGTCSNVVGTCSNDAVEGAA
jgi:hypothetical protein